MKYNELELKYEKERTYRIVDTNWSAEVNNNFFDGLNDLDHVLDIVINDDIVVNNK